MFSCLCMCNTDSPTYIPNAHTCVAKKCQNLSGQHIPFTYQQSVLQVNGILLFGKVLGKNVSVNIKKQKKRHLKPILETYIRLIIQGSCT